MPGLGAQYRDILLDQSRTRWRRRSRWPPSGSPTLEVSHELRTGFPIGTLADEARRARLMVVGDRGLNSVTGLVAGSVAVALAAHAACPVVVVRGDEQPGSAALPILLGVDASPVSEAAIAFAYQAAAERGVPLVAVHSWTEAFAAPALTSLMYRSEDQAYEEELLAQRLAGWAEKYPEVEVDAHRRARPRGPPADREVARRAAGRRRVPRSRRVRRPRARFGQQRAGAQVRLPGRDRAARRRATPMSAVEESRSGPDARQRDPLGSHRRRRRHCRRTPVAR